MMKKLFILITTLLTLTACTDAELASYNLTKAADMFELDRRIVFYNTWKGEYLLSIEGRCSIQQTHRVAVTCKTGSDHYKKHFLGLSGHVTYFSEQLEASGIDTYHYKVIFKPSVIIPDIDIR